MSTLTLPNIQRQLNLYGYTIFMILGNIGNLFIVLIFSRQRQKACSIYILNLAIMNDLYLTFNSLVQIFPIVYTDQTISELVLCKIRFYISNVFGQIAKTMLILACIDRFMSTSDRVIFREWHTPKRAKWLVFFSIIFCFLYASHIAIMTTVTDKGCGTIGIYSIIYSVYTLIFVGLIPPIILCIFGYLTYCNMRDIHNRVRSIVNHDISLRRRDRELMVIVISEVFFYIITTSPYPIIVLEMMISRYVISNKTIQYSQIESFIFTIAFLLLFVNNTAPFYIYLIVSKSFRRNFKQLFIDFYGKLRRQTPVRIIPRRY